MLGLYFRGACALSVRKPPPTVLQPCWGEREIISGLVKLRLVVKRIAVPARAVRDFRNGPMEVGSALLLRVNLDRLWDRQIRLRITQEDNGDGEASRGDVFLEWL